MKKKSKQQKACAKRRKEILKELKSGVSKSPMQKLKILFGCGD